MSAITGRALVVGAGIFGVAAATEMNRRGWTTTLADPGPLPHPLAASTDISKVIRLAYGTDEAYTELMEEAIGIWREWNQRWPEPLFHETGVLVLTRGPMAPGGFEQESFRVLEHRGRRPIRVTSADLRRRFPGWKAQTYADGFFHAEGGFAESGRVVGRLIEEARLAGVEVRPGCAVAGWLEEGGRIRGIITPDGGRLPADRVILAAGAWTGRILPELSDHLRPTAHPIYHFRPPNTRLYTERLFPVFTADISATGWYGFPLHPGGVVKIANHGPGRPMDPALPRDMAGDDERDLRRFLEETFPTLAPLPAVEKRWCLYCDSPDEHFWIANHPDRPGLTVAAGDSGHGFKFAPVIGRIIADAAEEKDSPWRRRFRWRTDSTPRRGEEEARFHG